MQFFISVPLQLIINKWINYLLELHKDYTVYYSQELFANMMEKLQSKDERTNEVPMGPGAIYALPLLQFLYPC